MESSTSFDTRHAGRAFYWYKLPAWFHPPWDTAIFLFFSMLHFLNLPPELQLLIVDYLPLNDVLSIRLTCAYFFDLIPRLSHEQLLLVETTEWARHRNLYACRYCVRLRPEAKFADRMLRRRRTISGRDSGKRFCVDCGLQPRNGSARYGPGAQVAIQGQLFVICLTCHLFRPAVNGQYALQCRSCWQEQQGSR